MKKFQKGQSLYELVVAIAIMALITMAVVSLATNSIQNSTYSKNNSLASSYAQEATEWLRGQRDADINNLVSNSSAPPGKSWCLSDEPLTNSSWNKQFTCSGTNIISGTSFLRNLKLITTSPLGKTLIEADVTVSWTDAKGTHTVTNATNFSDWGQR